LCIPLFCLFSSLLFSTFREFCTPLASAALLLHALCLALRGFYASQTESHFIFVSSSPNVLLSRGSVGLHLLTIEN
jgi:hypothetical protein